jgi:hypothetical protein
MIITVIITAIGTLNHSYVSYSVQLYTIFSSRSFRMSLKKTIMLPFVHGLFSGLGYLLVIGYFTLRRGDVVGSLRYIPYYEPSC